MTKNIAYFVVSGQSLTDSYFVFPSSQAAFRAEFLAHNPEYTDVQFFDAARGGSAMTRADAALNGADNGNPETTQNYWYDERTGGDGPTLDLFSDNLADWAQGKQVLGIIWDQGEADTRWLVNHHSIRDYKIGLEYTLQRLISLSGGDIPVYMQGFGDRSVYSETLHAGADTLHAIQQQFADDHSWAHLVSNTIDLPLFDTVHLTEQGYVTAAIRMAMAISTGAQSPTFDRVQMDGKGHILISFDMPQDFSLDTPSDAGAFQFTNESGASIHIDDIRVFSDFGVVSLRLKHPSDGGTLSYASSTFSFDLTMDEFLFSAGLPVQPFNATLQSGPTRIAERTDGFAFFGSMRAETLRGFVSDDELYGRKGADVLDGQAGTDRLWGGGGADSFVLARNGGLDMVYDFADGTDRIRVHGLVFSDLTILAYGRHDAEIRASDGTRMVLRNIDPDHITRADLDFI